MDKGLSGSKWVMRRSFIHGSQGLYTVSSVAGARATAVNKIKTSALLEFSRRLNVNFEMTKLVEKT